jgi:tetratricopeptide (TPR) repeat protein
MSFWKTPIKPWVLVVLFVLLPLIAVGGLSVYGYVTRPNYDRLDYGMSVEEVATIMGEPVVRMESGKHREWYCRGIRIDFDHGRLTDVNVGKASPEWPDARKIAVWTEMIRLNSRDETLYLLRGKVHEAIAAHWEWGDRPTKEAYLAARAEWEKAIVDFSEAIRLDPTSQEGYLARGGARERLGELDSSLDDYSTAIRLAPNAPEGYLGRGGVWERRSDREKAIAEYSEAIRVAPKNIHGYERRASVLKVMGDALAAQADREKIKELQGRGE